MLPPLSHLDLADGWLNLASVPLGWNQLLGRPVILHFWNRAILESMQDAHAVAALARQHSSTGLVVIGVHVPSPGAPATRRVVRSTVLQAGITHPIALDPLGRIARALSIRKVPSTLLVDLRGRIAAQLAGEYSPKALERNLENLEASNSDEWLPIDIKPEEPLNAPSNLHWPTAVVAQTPSIGREGKLVIADTNAARVIITDWPDETGACRVTSVVTSKLLARPQGLAFDPEHELLYIADAGSHRVLRYNVRTAELVPLLGSGTQGTDRRGGSSGTNQHIHTPSDIALDQTRNKLLISMAGLHQVWSLDLTTLVAKPIIGIGEHGVVDGQANIARLAHPVGLLLMSDRTSLFIADAQGPAVRKLDIAARTLDTIIGTTQSQAGATLSLIGHRDGTYPEARLAMPTALTNWFEPDQIAALDTDNNAIRIIDPDARTIKTWPAPCQLHQPQGIALAARLPSATAPARLFIADTAAHRIIQIDPQTHKAHELRISGIPELDHSTAQIPPHAERAAFNVPLDRPLEIEVGWDIPNPYILSVQEPVVIRISTAHPDETIDQVLIQHTLDSLPPKLTLPVMGHKTLLLVELSLAVQHREAQRCIVLAHAWRVRFGTDGGEPRLIARFNIPPGTQ